MMGLDERLSRWTLLDFLTAVADRSEGFAAQACVGGMETAGALISYLADHHEDIEPFMTGGIFELPPNWIELGRLTWHAQNGKIVHPRTARYARIVNQMKDATND